MLGASDQPLEQLPTMPKSSELIFSALQFQWCQSQCNSFESIFKTKSRSKLHPFCENIPCKNMGEKSWKLLKFLGVFVVENTSDKCILPACLEKKTWSQEWFTKTRSFGHISLVRQSLWSKQKQQLAQITDCQTELVSVRCWHRLAPFLDFLQLMQCSINSFHMYYILNKYQSH